MADGHRPVEVTLGLRREAPPDLALVGHDDALVARIRTEIQDHGPITFARYMSLAQYDPERGYYRTHEARPGREGDFLTAPEAHPIFGWAIARAVADAWQRLGQPASFTLREYGGGTGTLAMAILQRLSVEAPDLATAIRYEPVEVEPRRVEELTARFEAAGLADRLTRLGPASLATADRSPVEGVVLANEVLDALPTHRVVMRGAALREILVGWSDGGFVDVETAPTTRWLAERLAVDRVTLADGQRAEICLELDAWIAQAAAGLERGLLLVIDFGHPAPELYDPIRRRDGTLRAYVRHTVHDDPYRHVGRQDLTAHVDVTAVEAAATVAGLIHLGTTTQAEFLAGLGAGDLLRAFGERPGTTIEDYMAARASLMRMIDPAAMGRFRVMAFGRGWPAGQSLAGLDFSLRR